MTIGEAYEALFDITRSVWEAGAVLHEQRKNSCSPANPVSATPAIESVASDFAIFDEYRNVRRKTLEVLSGISKAASQYLPRKEHRRLLCNWREHRAWVAAQEIPEESIEDVENLIDDCRQAYNHAVQQFLKKHRKEKLSGQSVTICLNASPLHPLNDLENASLSK